MTICLLRHSGESLQMTNSSSENETDTLPERPTRIQPYQFEPVRQDFESTGTSCQLRHAVFHGVCEIALTEVLATQMGVMRRSKKVSSFEMYKLNPLSPLLYLGSSANCYSSWQHSRPAQLTFLSTTCIHSLLKNLRWQPH